MEHASCPIRMVSANLRRQARATLALEKATKVVREVKLEQPRNNWWKRLFNALEILFAGPYR